MSGQGHSNNRIARAKLGLVSHDNTGGYFIVECQGCGVVYPSFQCGGGDAIADTGDYNDAICPHCGQESPEECSNVGLVWNTQQLKINELQQRLTVADERVDVLEGLLRTSLAAMNRIYSAGRDFIVGAGSDCDSVELMMENDPTAREIRAALKPAEPAKDEHVCTGCGNKGWTANCKECVPY